MRIRPPLPSNKCQRFGHVAAACKGNKGSGKYLGNRYFIQSQTEAIKCCNCGKNHMSSFRGCEHHIRAVEVYWKMSYADALKKVRGLGESIRSVVSSSSSSLPMVKEVARQIIVKQSFLAFMTDKPNQSSKWW